MKKIYIIFFGMAVIATIGTAISFIYTPDNLPEDFKIIKRDIQLGRPVNLCTLPEEYYLIPEFYPSYSKYAGKVHDYSRWAIHGYGAYPGGVGLAVNDFKAGQSLNVCTFVHTSFSVESYQGMKLKMVGDTDKFDIQIIPDQFLLYPPFPSTDNNKWTKKINITIISKESVPPGNYILTLKAIEPDYNIQTQFYNEVMSVDTDQYNCPLWQTCNKNDIELREKTYLSVGTFSAEKFYDIEIIVN